VTGSVTLTYDDLPDDVRDALEQALWKVVNDQIEGTAELEIRVGPVVFQAMIQETRHGFAFPEPELGVLGRVGMASMRSTYQFALGRPAELAAAHCKDCCCAKSWEALGITEYTGRSIPEEITELRGALRESLEQIERGDMGLPGSTFRNRLLERMRRALRRAE